MAKCENNDDQKDVEIEKREQWSNPAEFFLTLIGYSVGPGNILRFPYLCMRNGGAAFLVAYFTFLFVCGVPLFILELAMGQSSRLGCLSCWDRFAPYFKGIGYTFVVLMAMATYVMQLYLAWILHYLYNSFTSSLPWTTCNATWNTANCVLTTAENLTEMCLLTNSTENCVLTTVDNVTTVVMNTSERMSAVEEYFQYGMLNIGSGVDDVSGFSWSMCLAYTVGWLIMLACLMGGIKSAGKVVWVSATAPYILITVFFIRAALLPGFTDGVRLYLTPKFDQLANPEVWVMAFIQIFYSLGPGWGGLITMASYNKPKHNFLIESFVCPIVCCLTSFYAGFVTFGTAGFLAYKKGVPVEEAMKSGPGIAFVSYPELAAHLPGSAVWAVLFFIMMIMVILDCVLILLEATVSAIVNLLRLPKRQHIYVLLVYSLLNIVMSLPLFTRAGMYIFQLVDWYFAVIAVFFTATCECVCVMWMYGYKRFYDDIYAMIGWRPLKFVLVPLIGVAIPLMLGTGMVWSVTNMSKPRFGHYVFPDWSALIGWLLAFSSLIPFLFYIVYKFIVNRRHTSHNSQDCELINGVPIQATSVA